MLLSASYRTNGNENRGAKPFCCCFDKRGPTQRSYLNACKCGEEHDISEWRWREPDSGSPSWVVLSDDKKKVIFHPSYSSGTATVKGDTPLVHDYHYYWEVKMLTETYGTDIMVGLGTEKVNINDIDLQFTFQSFLGCDGESYGLSYTGVVRHNNTTAQSSVGFCAGTIIGVRVDMWRGTLEFYLNRKPQGISFYNLRRHQELFPMICSTAAQSSMRLTYAGSWRASLLVDAVKILASSVTKQAPLTLPPGLWHTLSKQFWLTMPGEGCITDKDEEDMEEAESASIVTNVASGAAGGVRKRRYFQTVTTLPAARAAQHSAAA